MICRIYTQKNPEEYQDFTIKHFSERLIDGVLTLSCIVPIEKYDDNAIGDWADISAEKINKVQIVDKEAIVGEYTRYTKIVSVTVNYDDTFCGVAVFGKV